MKSSKLGQRLCAWLTAILIAINPIVTPIAALAQIHIWCTEYFLPIVTYLKNAVLGSDFKKSEEEYTVLLGNDKYGTEYTNGIETETRGIHRKVIQTVFGRRKPNVKWALAEAVL